MTYPTSSYKFKRHVVDMTWVRDNDLEKYKPITQVYGVVFNEKSQILICRESSDGKWQIPGGKPERGESLELALRRELKEEVDIIVGRILPLGVQRVEFPDNPNQEEGEKFYQVRLICEFDNLLPQTPDPASGNVWERMFVPVENVTEYIKWGSIGEAMFKNAVELWQKHNPPSGSFD